MIARCSTEVTILYGIVNGIDYDIYKLSTDEYIPCHYDDKTFDKGKKKNKASLQAKQVFQRREQHL